MYFDRRLLALRRLRAAAAAAVQSSSPQSPWTSSGNQHHRRRANQDGNQGFEDPLAHTVADHLLDRLRDVLRKDFGRVMVLGASHSMARPLIDRLMEEEGARSAAIEEVIVVDLHSPRADASWSGPVWSKASIAGVIVFDCSVETGVSGRRRWLEAPHREARCIQCI